jgi:hypothetical protein
MIKKILLLLGCINLLCSNIQTSSDKKMFSGSIEFPCTLNYDLCLFYKGQKLEVESNNATPFVQFSFLDYKQVHTVFLVITNGLTCSARQSNNVDCLCVADESSYICYKLQATRETDDQDHQLLSWQIAQHTLEDGQIPNTSLIFLFDPELIAGLKIQSWKPENVFRIIPTIVINPHTSSEQIKRAMIVARLAALDIDAIHAKPEVVANPAAILTALQ